MRNSILIIIFGVLLSIGVYANKQIGVYDDVPVGPVSKLDTGARSFATLEERNNKIQRGLILEQKDILFSEIYINNSQLVSNVIPIEENPYEAAHEYVSGLNYSYVLIEEEGNTIGIAQTVQLNDEILYEHTQLTMHNIVHSQLFFEQEIEGEQWLYFTHYYIEEIPEDQTLEKYFVMYEVVNATNGVIAQQHTFEIARNIDIFRNKKNPVKFAEYLFTEFRVVKVVVANDGTLYVNNILYMEYETKGGHEQFIEQKEVSQLFSISREAIEERYILYDYFISNLRIDNNNVLYFLADVAPYQYHDKNDIRYYYKEKHYYEESTIDRTDAASFVFALDQAKLRWQIDCSGGYYGGCYDLQLNSAGALYLLTSSTDGSKWHLDWLHSQYEDNPNSNPSVDDLLATIYTIRTNASGVGGYSVPALSIDSTQTTQDISQITLDTAQLLQDIPQETIGILNDNDVNVRAGFGLEHEVVLQVFQQDRMQLIQKTKIKYSIGEMHDYWYRGYVLEEDGVTRKTQNGEELEGWIYGAFIDFEEVKSDQNEDNGMEQPDTKEDKTTEALNEVSLSAEDANSSLSGDNNTPSPNTMLLLISSGIALLLVGLGVIIIVRKKQNKKTNTKEG